MRSAWFVIAALISAVSCGDDRRAGGATGESEAERAATTWRAFEPPRAHFAVSMPGEPTPVPGSGQVGNGMTVWMWHVVTPARAEYTITEMSFDPAVYAASDLHADGAIAGLLGGFGGAEHARREVTLGGHPGIEVRVVGGKHREIAGEAHAMVRIFLVGHRAWAQVVFHPAAAPLPAADIDRFFGSLRITGEHRGPS